MNANQRRVLIICLSIFFLSVIYVPTFEIWRGEIEQFQYSFIWSLDYDIALKVIFVEWFGIAVIFTGLMFLFKDKND